MDPPSSFPPRIKNLELKDPFKKIFFLFKMSSVFPITFKCNTSWKAKLLSLYSLLLVAFFLLPSVRYIRMVSTNLVFHATNAAAVFFRVLLGQKLRRMQGLALRLQRRDPNGGTPRWIKAWAVASTALHVPQLVSYFVVFSAFGHVSNPVLNATLSLLLGTVNVAFVILPVNTFAIFYVLVCRRLRSAIEDFATSVNGRDFGALLRSHRSIKRTVGLADKELSFLVFCSVVLSSMTTFLTISYLLMDSYHSRYAVKLSMLAYFAISQASFLAMTVSASAVSEAADKLVEAAEGLLEVGGHRRMGAAELRFLMAISAARGEMALTVWKIVPIRRNFIIGTTGAIFTYVILIDGFLKVTTSGK